MTRNLTLFISLSTIAAVVYVMAPAASPLTAPKSSVAPRSSADMRPIAWIPTHGSKRTPENPTGLRQRFFDPEAGYRSLLNELLSRPFDRFIIHQPAGWVEEKVDGKRMGGAQYWAIDEKHLRMWTRAIHDAMRLRPEITVGIYGSLSLRYTHDIGMSDPGWHVADFDSPRDRWALWQQSIAPWVRAGYQHDCYS